MFSHAKKTVISENSASKHEDNKSPFDKASNELSEQDLAGVVGGATTGGTSKSKLNEFYDYPVT